MRKSDERKGVEAASARTRLSTLDLTDEALSSLSEQASALANDYFARVPELPVFPETSADRLARRFEDALPLEGRSLERIMDDCREIIAASRHNGHPRFFGYVASPSTAVGAYADLIASSLNANLTSWRSAPAPTLIEKIVVGWLSQLVGYGENAHGLLTSGGSMANLNALLMAQRSRSEQNVSEKGLWNSSQPMTLYASEQVHLSIPKAADVMGIGREQVRLLRTDERFKLDVEALRERIESDRRAGFVPFCVVASAGTVNTGAVDPLEEIARVAEEHNLWFHVDGAYGALGSLDETKRSLFKGLERADSVSLDPHKWLYAPVDAGCLLFRDAERARKAFTSHEADYIKVHEETDAESFAFWDYGVELSRRFRALKIWMMLSYYGARRICQAITEDMQMATHMAERIRAAGDLELLAPVELSICCFRYVPVELREPLKTPDEAARKALNQKLDELNARIMHTLQREGRAYLSNATVAGVYALRACITNFRTTRADIDETLAIVRDVASRS